MSNDAKIDAGIISSRKKDDNLGAKYDSAIYNRCALFNVHEGYMPL